MKKLLVTTLLAFASTSGVAQTGDQRPSAPPPRYDDSDHGNWGWIGLIGLAGLGGLAGRNRRTDINQRDRDASKFGRVG